MVSHAGRPGGLLHHPARLVPRSMNTVTHRGRRCARPARRDDDAMPLHHGGGATQPERDAAAAECHRICGSGYLAARDRSHPGCQAGFPLRSEPHGALTGHVRWPRVRRRKVFQRFEGARQRCANAENEDRERRRGWVPKRDPKPVSRSDARRARAQSGAREERSCDAGPALPTALHGTSGPPPAREVR